MAGVGGGSSEDCLTVSRTTNSEGGFRDPPSGVVSRPDGRFHAPHCRAPLTHPGIEGDAETVSPKRGTEKEKRKGASCYPGEGF